MENFDILKTQGFKEAPDVLLPRIRRRIFIRRVYRVSASLLLAAVILSSLLIVQRAKPASPLTVQSSNTALDSDIVDLGSPFLQIGVEDSQTVYEIDVAVAGPILEL